MSLIYTYRPEMGITNSLPMRSYDQLYQRAAFGMGIPWQLGMWFPMMAREEGVPRHRVQGIVDNLDHWMASFMMTNQAKWEQRNAR